MQLTATALDFYTVDTIRSQTSNEFEITANLMTFNNAETTLDNTDTTKTFLHTSKQYFDLGLSAGVYVDPVFLDLMIKVMYILILVSVQEL